MQSGQKEKTGVSFNKYRLAGLSIPAIVPIAGGLAFAGSAEARPIPYVGAATNEMWVKSPSQAEKVAEIAESLGLNAIRQFTPVTANSAEVNNDDEYCVSAIAARKHGITLFYDMVGYKKDGSLGYMPKDLIGKKRFVTKIVDAMYETAGPNGCIADIGEFNVEIGNEVNGKLFVPEGYTAADYVDLLTYVYPRLHAEADKTGVKINVIAGNLAFGSGASDPYEYISAMGEAKVKMGYVGPIFDTFTYHPYPTNLTRPLDNIIAYQKIMSSLKKAFGYEPPVMANEIGLHTVIPKDMSSRYTGKNNANILRVDEASHASFVRSSLGLVACQPNNLGWFNYRISDESELTRWQSGFFYARRDWNSSLVPKSSATPAQAAIIGARNGMLVNC